MFRLLRCQELSRWPGHSSHFLLHTNVLSSNPFVHLSRISCSTVSLIGSGKFSHFAPCPRFFFSSNCWFIFTDPLIFFFLHSARVSFHFFVVEMRISPPYLDLSAGTHLVRSRLPRFFLHRLSSKSVSPHFLRKVLHFLWRIRDSRYLHTDWWTGRRFQNGFSWSEQKMKVGWWSTDRRIGCWRLLNIDAS